METFGVPQGSILAHLMFIIYVSDHPLRINSLPEPIIFTDDTRVMISIRNFGDFCMISNLVLSHMIEWFAANSRTLNLEKTNVMKSVMINSPHCALTIGYKDNYREETVNTKFLGLHLDKDVNWKDHIDK
jgi:hypothetical protein